MTTRQKPCPDCGAGIVLASAPNGGTMRLQPWPDPGGRYRVDVLDRTLMVLAERDPSSARTKRYDPHSVSAGTCVSAGKAAPRQGRPEQIGLDL